MRYPKHSERIGAFEAKTHLSELLRETEMGRAFVIERRGKPVARLVPAEDPEPADLKGLDEAFREVRAKVKGKLSVRELIEEGRRF
jgi:prevent-host-death family protein